MLSAGTVVWMLSRCEKLNVAEAGSGIEKMVCAVVLVRFKLNSRDDEQSASRWCAMLEKQADAVPRS